MKKELNPAIFWGLLVVVLVVAVVLGYKYLAPKSFKADTTGSDQSIQKVQKGGTFYTPPAGYGPAPGTGTGQTAPFGGK